MRPLRQPSSRGRWALMASSARPARSLTMSIPSNSRSSRAFCRRTSTSSSKHFRREVTPSACVATVLTMRLRCAKSRWESQSPWQPTRWPSPRPAAKSQICGDEIIATWTLAAGLNEGACVRACFAALDRLAERGPAYERDFGCCADFRAGLHCGSVVIGELGYLRRRSR